MFYNVQLAAPGTDMSKCVIPWTIVAAGSPERAATRLAEQRIEDNILLDKDTEFLAAVCLDDEDEAPTQIFKVFVEDGEYVAEEVKSQPEVVAFHPKQKPSKTGMRTMFLQGYSDDLIYVRGPYPPYEEDEYPLEEGHEFYIASSPEVGIKVKPIYDGVWSFAVKQLDEGISIPADWHICIQQAPESQYSTQLTIAFPEDQSVVLDYIAF
jgi:hypothetical protein